MNKFVPILRRNSGYYILPIDITTKESVHFLRDMADIIEQSIESGLEKNYLELFGLKVEKAMQVYFKLKPYKSKEGGEALWRKNLLNNLKKEERRKQRGDDFMGGLRKVIVEYLKHMNTVEVRVWPLRLRMF